MITELFINGDERHKIVTKKMDNELARCVKDYFGDDVFYSQSERSRLFKFSTNCTIVMGNIAIIISCENSEGLKTLRVVL